MRRAGRSRYARRFFARARHFPTRLAATTSSACCDATSPPTTRARFGFYRRGEDRIDYHDATRCSCAEPFDFAARLTETRGPPQRTRAARGRRTRTGRHGLSRHRPRRRPAGDPSDPAGLRQTRPHRRHDRDGDAGAGAARPSGDGSRRFAHRRPPHARPRSSNSTSARSTPTTAPAGLQVQRLAPRHGAASAEHERHHGHEQARRHHSRQRHRELRRTGGADADDANDDVTVSWLPLYHDMGLVMSVILPLRHRHRLGALEPLRFPGSIRPPTCASSRASAGRISTMPNFGFELATRRSREDRLGQRRSLGMAQANCGAEPIDVRVIDRFVDRFAPHGFSREAIKPGYGLAEATLTVTLTGAGEPAALRAIPHRLPSPVSPTIEVTDTGSFDDPLPPCGPDETEVISVGSALRGLDTLVGRRTRSDHRRRRRLRRDQGGRHERVARLLAQRRPPRRRSHHRACAPATSASSTRASSMSSSG